MAYIDFTLAKVKQAFGLTLEEPLSLFAEVSAVAPSTLLTQTLAENTFLATAIGTEKARSELLIAPILVEVRRHLQNQASLFSGTEFTRVLYQPSAANSGNCAGTLQAASSSHRLPKRSLPSLAD